MKIPEKIKVAGHTYKVIWDDEYLSNQDYLGLAVHRELLIYLCKTFKGSNLPKSLIEQNCIHEILHCIDTVYNNHELSENQVDRLAEGLYQVLKDNFKL